jgi:hypothetical protein
MINNQKRFSGEAIVMSSESADNDKLRPPKNRGEVYTQEQQRIAEETNK